MSKSTGLIQKNTFSKRERLNNESLIKELFNRGSSFYLGPLKIVYLYVDKTKSETNQVLFTVPKKRFKKAVDRNLLKRRMREAYRLHNSIKDSLLDQSLLIAYIYIGKEIFSYSLLESKLVDSFRRLKREISDHVNSKE